MSRRLLLPLLLSGSLGLGGCISLLPKSKPAQLYSFASGAASNDPAPIPTTSGPGRVGLIFPPVSFPRAAAGDQILTQTGPESAYVAGVRWVSPAAVLFGEAVERAFDARSARVRLLSRQEIAGAQGFLRLEVVDFEARYPAPEAAPVVRVAVTATAAHRTGVFAADRTFAADVPAAENGARAIVDAYGRAVSQVAGEIVAWADANADRAAEEGPSVSAAAPSGRTATSSTTTSTTVTPPRR